MGITKPKAGLPVIAAIIIIVSFSTFACSDDDITPQDYTVTNMLGYDVKVFTGDGRDPTGLTPDGENTDYGDGNTWSCAREDPVLHPIHSETGVVLSGKTVTFADAILSGWSFYVIEAREFEDGYLGGHVFIRKFTWEELEALGWSVAIEPGYEEPSWGPPTHNLTIHNRLDKAVAVEAGGTDDPQGNDWDGWTFPYIDSGDSVRHEYVIKEGYAYYFIRAIERENIVGPQRSETPFVRRFTWKELQQLDWEVVMESGYENSNS